MTFDAFIVLLLLSSPIWLGLLLFAERKGRNALEHKKLHIRSEYKLDEFYMAHSDQSLVGLNFNEHKIVLGSLNQVNAYDFAQISSVEVVENDITLTQTNRGSQLLGAAVGGLLSGGIGAVVGGLSGSSRSQVRIQDISLKVRVDDRTQPIHTIRFFRRDKNGFDPNHPWVKEARSRVDRFHAHILNAMRESKPKVGVPPTPVPFAADELQKLWNMKEAGILTDDEFAQQKARLLAQSGEPELASAASAPLPQSATYSLVLVDHGGNIIKVIKEVKNVMPHLGLKEAKDLVDAAPTVLITGLSSDDAKRISQALVIAGASTKLMPDSV